MSQLMYQCKYCGAEGYVPKWATQMTDAMECRSCKDGNLRFFKKIDAYQDKTVELEESEPDWNGAD